jgi:chromate transporter
MTWLLISYSVPAQPPGKRILSPWTRRHRDNAQLKGFVQGATVAPTGAITRSVILGQRSIFDAATAAIGLVSLTVLLRFRRHEPLAVVPAGVAVLALRPPVQGG